MRKRVEAGEGGSCNGLEWMLGNGHPNQGDSSRIEKEGLNEQVFVIEGLLGSHHVRDFVG